MGIRFKGSHWPCSLWKMQLKTNPRWSLLINSSLKNTQVNKRNEGGLLRSQELIPPCISPSLPVWTVKIMKEIIKGKLCKWRKGRNTRWGRSGGRETALKDEWFELICSMGQPWMPLMTAPPLMCLQGLPLCPQGKSKPPWPGIQGPL